MSVVRVVLFVWSTDVYLHHNTPFFEAFVHQSRLTAVYPSVISRANLGGLRNERGDNLKMPNLSSMCDPPWHSKYAKNLEF